MRRWGIFVVVVCVAPSPAGAVDSFVGRDAPSEMLLPTNGRLAFDFPFGGEPCKFWFVRRGQRVPAVATDWNPVPGRAGGMTTIAPTRPLSLRSSYHLRWSCDGFGGKGWLKDWNYRRVRINTTAAADEEGPKWHGPPTLVARHYSPSDCGNSPNQITLDFRVPVTDESRVTVEALLWSAGEQPVKRRAVVDKQRVSITVNARSALFQSSLTAGAQSFAFLCATDAAGFESCAPGPVVSFVAPTVCDDPFYREHTPSCQSTAAKSSSPPAASHHVAPPEEPPALDARVAAICVLWLAYLLLITRRARNRRVMAGC